MVKPQLIDEKPIALVEVKDELNKIQARDEELNFRAGKCLDYLNDFVELSLKKSVELREKLAGLGISRLKEDHILHIIDLLPKTLDEVKVVLQSSSVIISKKDMESIAALVKEFE